LLPIDPIHPLTKDRVEEEDTGSTNDVDEEVEGQKVTPILGG